MASRRPPDARVRGRMLSAATGGYGFAIVIAFLVAEYGRPQDKVSVIGLIHPTWILVILLVFAWFGSKKVRTVSCPQIWIILLMLGLCAIHVPLASNTNFAYQVTFGFFIQFAFCASAVLFIDTEARLRTFLKWWSFLAFYISANTVLGLGIAGSGFLGDENDVGLLLNVMLPVVFFMFKSERERLPKLTYLAISLLCVIAMVSTRSRGTFVGLLTVVAIIWALSPRRLLSLVIILVLATSVYVGADQKYWDRMGTIEETDQGTAKVRLDSWQAGWDMFKDHPFGVGPGNFPIHFPEYQPVSMSHSMWGRAAHSLWFTLLPELGIPGVILFVALLLANLKDIRRLRRLSGDSEAQRLGFNLGAAYFASMAGYFASGTFISVLYYPHYWYLSSIIVVSGRVLANGEGSKPSNEKATPVGRAQKSLGRQ